MGQLPWISACASLIASPKVVVLPSGGSALYRFETRRMVSNLRIHEISYAAR